MERVGSVRVEVEDQLFDNSGFDVPDAPKEPRSRNSVAIGVSLAALLGLVLALLALQPDDGETAAGTERQATTTVPTTTVPPIEDPDTDGSISGVSPLDTFVEDVQEFLIEAEATQVEFGPRFGRIVATDDGFLGLHSTGALAGLPGLFESIDGQTWTRSEVVVPDLRAFDHGDVWVNYSDLVATEDGFALLRSETTFSQTFPDFERVALVHRLISPDGRNWSVDPDFQASSNFSAVNPVLHLPDAIVTLAADPEAEATSIGEQRSNDPEQFSAVSECVTVQAERGGDVALNIARRGEQADVAVSSRTSILHTAIRGGSFASLHLGDLVGERGTDCSVALGLSAAQDAPSVEIVDIESGAQRSIPLPEAATDVPFDAWAEPKLVGADDSLFAILANTLWQLDLRANGAWTELGPLPVSPESDIEEFFITPDGRVVGLTNDLFVIADYSSGEITRTPDIGVVRTGQRIVYLDNEVVLLSTTGSETQTFSLESVSFPFPE